MKLTVTMMDHAPNELDEQVPFTFELLRPMPGPKRSGYWLGALDRPLVWIIDNHERQIDHVVVWARSQGTQIGPGFKSLPIGIAYVTDPHSWMTLPSASKSANTLPLALPMRLI